MKCVILAENLRKALTLVERSAGKDLTLPILSSFLINAESGAINIMSTNLEIGVRVSVRGTIHDQGRVVIPTKALSGFMPTVPRDEKVTLGSTGQDLVLEIGSQKTVFKGYAQEDFPPFPIVKELWRVVFKKTDILPTLTKSLVSVSRSTIKPELASIYILLEKDQATIATTDSFRLSEDKMKPVSISSKVGRESFLIPLRTAEELIKLLEYGSDEEVTFSVGNGEILVLYTNVSLYSRLTEGSYPEYQQIIPKKFTTQMKVSRSVFSSHVRRASIFTNKLQGITLTPHPQKDTCLIESNNTSVGEYKADFQAEVSGDGLIIVFNYKYLLDGVDSFSDEELLLGFNGENQPLVIRPVKREKSLYVVMPMKGVA